MRLATWNVRHGRSSEDGRVGLGRFAAAVGELDVDVLALQEVDRAQPRSHGADLGALSAHAVGAPHRWFAPAIVGAPGGSAHLGPADTGWVCTRDDELAPPGPSLAPAYGIALASRHPVLAWRVLRLPTARIGRPALRGRPRRPALVPEEPRVALAARVRAPEGIVTVVTTHLSCTPGWNLLQLRRLVAAFAGGDDALVLLGDLNAGRRAVGAASGLAALAAGPTFPSRSPLLQLDHVLGRGVTGVDARVHRLPVSDHRALAVTVAMPGAADGAP